MSNQKAQPTVAEAIVMLAEMQVATLKLIQTMGRRIDRLDTGGQVEEALDKTIGKVVARLEFELDQMAAARAQAQNTATPPAGNGGAA